MILVSAENLNDVIYAMSLQGNPEEIP